MMKYCDYISLFIVLELEKSKNESPEKLEKFRKISDECAEEVMISAQEETPVNEVNMDLILLI